MSADFAAKLASTEADDQTRRAPMAFEVARFALPESRPLLASFTHSMACASR